MLTRALGISKIEGRYLIPDRLVRNRDAAYLPLAQTMLEIYQQGLGLSRQVLHRRVEEAFFANPEAPPRRIAAFCKLLDDRSEYEVDERGSSARLRMQVFRLAAGHQPLGFQAGRLVGNSVEKAREALEKELKLSWGEIEKGMYLDLPQNQTLLAFDSFAGPAELLARYNVAQAQVALFDASEMKILARSDFKYVLRYIKLARLMHRVKETSSGYLFELDGPASLLQETRRYGIAMAKMLPGLLSCRDWQASATIRSAKFGTLRWSLSSESGLTSQVPRPSEFDSSLEEEFFEAWGNSDTQGWVLQREANLLVRGQNVYTPDFTAVDQSGRRVLLEIVGYWTPEYLEHKRAQLETFCDERILLLLPESSQETLPQLGSHTWLAYKTRIPIPQLIGRLAQMFPC